MADRFEKRTPRGVVYLRPVAVEALPSELRDRVDIRTPQAVHDAEGKRLAIALDREVALAFAAQNDLTVRSVH